MANWAASAQIAWTSAGLAVATLAFCSAACAITRLRSGRDLLTRRLQEADELQRVAGQAACADSMEAAATIVLGAARREASCDVAVLVPAGAGPDRPSWRVSGSNKEGTHERIDATIDIGDFPARTIIDCDGRCGGLTDDLLRGLLPDCRTALTIPVTKPGGGPVAAIVLGFASPIWPGKTDMPWLSELAAGLAEPLARVRAHEELRALAYRDPMTGLLNYRAFRQQLAEEMGRAVRYGHNLSLLLVDVDRFKRVNDTYGHPAGDEVLRHVARVIQAHVRAIDVAVRYGGEEFAIICPETEADEAVVLAERLRVALEATSVDLATGGNIAVTMSMGVSVFPACAITETNLISAADAALYDAKRNGRNRVVLGVPEAACGVAVVARPGPIGITA